MPLYQFDCKKCKVIFEELGEISKPPKRRKCPKCKKQAKRAIVCPAMKIAGEPMKWSKSDVTRLYNEFIDDTKDRIENPKKSPYASYDLDEKYAKEHNMGRKLSAAELAKKVEIARKQTADANELLKNNPV